MREQVEVEVAGRSYRLRADDEGADLSRVAEFVNARIQEVRNAIPGISTERAAILAALNVGDELLREREAVARAVDTVRERLRDIERRTAGVEETTVAEPA